MKTKELRQKSKEELGVMLKERKIRIEELRFLLPEKKIKNVKEMKMVKRDVAKILTLLKQ